MMHNKKKINEMHIKVAGQRFKKWRQEKTQQTRNNTQESAKNNKTKQKEEETEANTTNNQN
jgi:hypothetical protein